MNNQKKVFTFKNNVFFNFNNFNFCLFLDLENAIAEKDYSKLENSLKVTKFEPMKTKLRKERNIASELMNDIRELRTIQLRILDLQRKRVNELRSYKIPPPLIYQVIKATFTLVSIPENEVNNWDSCCIYLTNIGSKSIFTKMKKLKIFDVDLSIIKKVNNIIEGIKKQEILLASRCAAAFFYWTKTCISTYLKVNKQKL